MADTEQRRIARQIVDQFGGSYAEEAGVMVRDTPQALYKLLCFSLLASARIRADIAAKASRAVFDQGWTTPQKLSGSSWNDRAKVLNEAGCARYDERTSTMLADSAKLLLDRWNGDLRKLREGADHDPNKERQLLQSFNGIGPAGANIFARHAQTVWPELQPSVDERALKTARRIGLGDDAEAVAELVPAKQLPRFVDGLIRMELENRKE